MLMNCLRIYNSIYIDSKIVLTFTLSLSQLDRVFRLSDRQQQEAGDFLEQERVGGKCDLLVSIAFTDEF